MARPKSDNKRKAILESAMELFAERGIGHAPTSAISAAAGVAEGTLFTYFKTKDELLNELYRELRKEMDRETGGLSLCGGCSHAASLCLGSLPEPGHEVSEAAQSSAAITCFGPIAEECRGAQYGDHGAAAYDQGSRLRGRHS